MTSTAAPQQRSDASLTWKLVHAEPGTLVFAAPGVAPVHPLVRRAARRASAWSPDGVPVALRPQDADKHPALHHAEYIGRVGLLAAALGVGAAVVGQQPAIAWAEPSETDTTPSTSTSAPADTTAPARKTEGTEEDTAATTTAAEPRDTAETEVDEDVAEAPVSAETEPQTGAEAAEVAAEEPEVTADEPTEEVVTEAAPTDSAVEAAQPAGQQPTGTESDAAPRRISETAKLPSGQVEGRVEQADEATRTPAMLQAPSPVEIEPSLPVAEATPVVTEVPASVAAEPAPAPQAPAPVSLVNQVIDTVLAPTTAATPAAQAAQTPILFGLFAWLRKTFFNSTPTLSYDPSQTAQAANTVTGRITGIDADDDALTYTVSAPTNGGTVVVHPDGTFTYTAPAGMHASGGTDTFTVTATDAPGYFHIHGFGGFLNMISFGLLGNPGHAAAITVTLTVAAFNAAPVAGSPAFSLGEVDHSTGATPGQLHVTDPNSDTLHYTVTGGHVSGDVEIDLYTGAFTYTPTPEARHAAAGTAAVDMDNFTVTVDDQHGGVITVPVSVAIDIANAQPVITGIELSDPDDDTGAVHVSITVTDPDTNDPVTYIVVQNAGSGSVVVDPLGGGVIYTPTPEAREAAAATPGIDTDTFTIAVSDEHTGLTLPETIEVEIDPTNIAPVAVGDAVGTDEDTPVTGNVLTNDTDVEHATLTAHLVNGPSHGTLSLADNGDFTYTPDENWSGSDSFTYTASDGTLASNDATVTVTINPVNDAPAINTVTVTPGTGNTWVVTASASDPDGDPLSVTLTPTDPGHVSVTGGNAVTVSDAAWAAAHPGEQLSGTVTVDDGHGGTVSTTVPIGTVNNVIAVGGNYLGQTNIPALPAGVTYTQVAAARNHTVLLRSDGTAVAVGYNGAGQLNIPALPNGMTYTQVAAGTYHTVLLRSDGTVVAVGSDGTGQLDVPNNTPGTYTQVAAGDTHTVLLRSDGTAVAIGNDSYGQTAIPVLPGGVTYTQVAAGSFHTVLLRSDGTAVAIGNSGSGQLEIPVLPEGVTYTQVAAGDTHTVLLRSDGTAVAIGNNGSGQLNIPVLPDGMTYTQAAAGRFDTVLLRSDGAAVAIGANGNGQINIPTLPTGVVYIDIAASDYHTVLLSGVNTAPSAGDDAFSTTEDIPLVITPNQLLGNDSDPDGAPLSVTAVWGASHGTTALASNGTITYTPNANYTGTDTFQYLASDGNLGDAATVTVTVTAVNDAPVAVDDSVITAEDTAFTGNVLTNDTDAENYSLTTHLVNGPSYGTLDLQEDGSFTYSPNAHYHGDDAFTYTASDGSLTSNTATVHITVTARPPAPPVTGSDSYTMAEDTTLSVAAPGLLANDTDPNFGDVLVAQPVKPPSHGVLGFNPSGAFTYTPDADFYGEDTFTYNAVDQTGRATLGTVTITVTPVNDAPVAGPDSFTVAEDSVLNVSGPGVLANDTDADHDGLFATLATDPGHGGVILNPDGSFTYTPDADFWGDDSFGYYVHDTNGGTSQGTVTITVSPVNDAPVPGVPAYTIDNWYPTTGVVEGAVHATDPEGAALTYSAPPTSDKGGTVTVTPDGGFVYVPTDEARHDAAADDANLTGANKDSFTVTVTDADGAETTVAVKVSVSPANIDPVGSGPTIGVPNVAGVVSGSLNVSDADHDDLTYWVKTAPASGQLVIDPATGGFTYTPYTNARLQANLTSALETDTFTVTVGDGHNGYTDVTVSAVPVSAADAVATNVFNVGVSPLGVAVNKAGTRAYIANEGSDTVSVIDTTTGALLASAPVGSHPVGVAVTPNGKYVYVVNQLGGTVSVIDTELNSNVATIFVGSGPQQVAIDPDGNFAYVSNRGGNSVSVIDLHSNSAVDTIAVSGQPYGIAVSPNGSQAYVTRTNSNSVDVIDTTSRSVTNTITVGAMPYGVAFSPDGSHAYVANLNGHSVSVIDTSTGGVVATVTGIAGRPAAVAVSPDGSVVYVSPLDGSNVVTLIDAATNTVVDTVTTPAGNAVPGIAVSPDGIHVYVTNQIGARLTVLTLDAAPNVSATINSVNPTTGQVAGTVHASDPAGQTVTVTNTAPALGAVLVVTNGDGTWSFTYTPTENARIHASATPGADTDSFTVTVTDVSGVKTNLVVTPPISPLTPTVTASLSGLSLPTSVVLSPDGTRAYVANKNSGQVSVIDTGSNTLLTNIAVDSQPQGIAISPNGRWVYVTNYASNTVSVIDTTTNTRLTNIAVSSNPFAVTVSRDGTRAYVTLINASQVAVIDTATNTLLTPISDGTVPIAAVVSPDGSKLYVANYANNSVLVYNTATRTQIGGAFAGTGPRAMAITADGSRVYIANDGKGSNNGSISVFNTSTNAVTTISTGGGTLYGIALDPDGTLAYVTNNRGGVLVIDTNPASPTYNTVLATTSTVGYPDGVAVRSDGTAYVANAPSNKLSVVTLVPTP